jgi:hypothetical protein
MRALLACGMLVVAGLAAGAPAAMSADTASQTPRSAMSRPPATVRPPATSRTTTRVGPSTTRRVSSTPHTTVPAALGGPAKYDAKKGAMLGGTVMPHRP